jgi:hypothetical protein
MYLGLKALLLLLLLLINREISAGSSYISTSGYIYTIIYLIGAFNPVTVLPEC